MLSSSLPHAPLSNSIILYKTVRHAFMDNGKKWYTETVISQVPGQREWLNIVL